jgi:hypothetical protein
MSDDQVILVVSNNTAKLKRVCDGLGIVDGHLPIRTRYFSADPVVKVISSSCVLESDLCRVGAIIVLDDCPDVVNQDLADRLPGDSVRILYTRSSDLLEQCIDSGFELILESPDDAAIHENEYGIPRIKEALKCRIWSSNEPECSTSSSTPNLPHNDEQILDSMDDFMNRIMRVRNATSAGISDKDRRAMAESIANELATLIGSDSEHDNE